MYLSFQVLELGEGVAKCQQIRASRPVSRILKTFM